MLPLLGLVFGIVLTIIGIVLIATLGWNPLNIGLTSIGLLSALVSWFTLNAMKKQADYLVTYDPLNYDPIKMLRAKLDNPTSIYYKSQN